MDHHARTPVGGRGRSGPAVRRRPDRNKPKRAAFEPLEERVMLAADDVISVGRTLSSWTADGVQGGLLKIEYTVYNQQPEAVTGVALATTLQPDVAYISASPSPGLGGATLSWDLGTIEPFGSASVEVTVTLASAAALAIDAGSHAVGVFEGRAVADDAPPASLRAGGVDPALLAATPDADPADPYIQAKAAELDQDPTQILAYLTRDVDYESYVGSLRGARGTLWSEAGNSLDQASLGVALLRASGVPARYARGTLSDALSQQLILSMFADPLRVVGFLNPGTPASDPAHDPALLAETRDHAWIQLDAGAGFQDADPSFATATIGTAFAAAAATFAEVPDALRHKVFLTVERELTQSDLFGGSSQSVATVLSDEFATSELVGRPITLGHMVSTTTSGFVISATVNTYTPYLLAGDGALASNDDPILTGTPYQEMLTNFPFGSQVLTGVFLKLHITSPDGTSIDVKKTIADRIGAAARLGGGGQVSIDPSGQPLITPLDLTTLSIEPGLYSEAAAEKLRLQLDARQAAFTSFMERVNATPDGPAKDALLQEVTDVMRGAFLSMARSRLAQFQILSDTFTRRLADISLVETYFATPRVIAVDSRAVPQDDGTVIFRFSMDLVRDVIRAIPIPGQAAVADVGFQLVRAMSESFVEQLAMGTPPQTSTGFPILPVGVVTVFQAAQAQNIPLLFLSPQNRNQLDALPISAPAKAFISQALDAGKTVMAPASSVQINGEARIGWYEFDPTSGAAVDVMDNGEHSSLIQSVATDLYIEFIRGVIQFNLGAVAGIGVGGLFNISRWLVGAWVERNKDGFPVDVQQFLAYKNWVGTLIAMAIQLAKGSPNVPFALGFLAGIEISFELSNDPPIEDLLLSPLPLEAFKNLGSSAAPGDRIATAIVPDPIYTLPIDGAQTPTMFRLGIKNLGSTTLRLALSMVDLPAGFTGKTSIREVVIPPGETAEIGLILFPTGALPAVGTTLDFGVRITDPADPTLTTTQSASFVMPAIHGVKVTTDRDDVSTSPGTPVQVKLRLEATGNVAETVHFQSFATSGLAVGGLSTRVLDPGQVIELVLTLTPAADAALNQTLGLRLVTEFGTPFPDTRSISVIVAVPGAAATATAAADARRLGQPDLAARLEDVGVAMTNLVGDPADPVSKGQALASLDAVLGLLAADPIYSAFADDVAASKARLAAATTPAEIQSAVVAVGAALDDFGAAVDALARGNVELTLLPSNQVAQPQTPSTFAVLVHNIGTEATTYTLSVAGLPAGVDALLSQVSVSLAPGAFATLTLTLTPTSTTDLSPFGFTVAATIAGSTPAIGRSVAGALGVRREFVSVVSVTPDRSFVNPGEAVNVAARVLNAVNRTQAARASFQVIDAGGQVVRTSTPVDLTLGVLTSITAAALGALDTTGLPVGSYTLRVTLTTPAGDPIPGGVGDGGLLIGSPVSSTLTLDRDQLPPGSSVVTSTLEIQAQGTLVGPLGVVSQTDVPGAVGVVRNGDFVYVSGASGIRVYNVVDPSSPQLITTFGVTATTLEIHDGKLYAMRRGGFADPLVLSIYSLADPAAPQLLGQTPPIFYVLGWHMAVSDTHVYVSLWSFTFLIGGVNDIKYQTGDLLSIDVSDPTAPHLDGVLRNTYGTNNDGIERFLNVDISGGDGNLWGIALLDPNTILVAGGTARGDDTQTGQGVVYVVDVSDPAHMAVVKTLVIPGTVMAVKLMVDGDRALVTASTGGWQDLTTDLPLSGNLVLATLDVSDHRNPVLLHSETLARASSGPYTSYSTPLGGGLFAFSSTGGATDLPEIFVVDASDPQHLQFSTTTIPAFTEALDGDGGYIYTASSSGLIIYQLDAADAIPVTARVEIPNAGGVAPVPGSFSIAPTRIIAGVGFDRYEWDLNLAAGSATRTITWRTTTGDLRPGEARAVTGATTIDFTSQATPGRLSLAPLVVAAGQILALDPAAQTTRPGESASYTVRVSNPTAAALTYTLRVLGLPAGWSALAPQVTVAANGSMDVPLTLISSPFAAAGDFGFTVEAAAGAIVGTVDGDLTLSGLPVVAAADPQSHGVVAALLPALAIAGLGGSARFVARLTNVGSVVETYALAISGLPAGYTATFDRDRVAVSPGAGGAVDVPFTIRAPDGAAVGDVPFRITAASTSTAAAGGVDGVLRVVSLGVRVAIEPTSAAPGSVVAVTVTNIGTTAETFDLALAGPASLAATLGASSVTLAPGASQVVSVAVGALGYALPGSVPLTATATARTNPAVRDADSVGVAVAAQGGVSARFEPADAVLAGPGARTFRLIVTNTGNAEDAFEVVLMGPSGPISGSLVRPDGSPTSALSIIRLPALGVGAVTLSARLLDFGLGALTVQVRSLNDASRAAAATATLRASAASLATATQVLAAPNPAAPGEAVTFTAYVSAQGGAVPTGQVTFVVDGQALAPVALSADVGRARATLTLTAGAGAHTVTAVYSGGTGFDPSASAAVAFTVAPPTTPGLTSTQVLVTPSPATVGQSLKLTAIVMAEGGVLPTGGVTFVVDGVDRSTVALANVGGRATAVLTIAGLAEGTHQVSARYAGDAAFAASASATSTVQVLAAAADVAGPVVTSVERYGFHNQPTSLVLRFNEDLDPAAASNAANYQILGPGRDGRLGTRDDRPIPLRDAVYDAATRSVTLRPTERLYLYGRSLLAVRAGVGAGVVDLAGNALDGDGDGRPGGDFVSVVDRTKLAGPAPTLGRKTIPSRRPPAFASSLHVAAAHSRPAFRRTIPARHLPLHGKA
ncbi:Ig-like domain repeat protein [Paludisphaera mucosa]|uniref:Ig-like domain repeat protein n=1 Tax=Paludisphaera mucosa TaxID=3030827 RepID=A0ABT6FBG0_9BACT|nr:Ig-like domain repeat protein [Paludisphaera mucosa]MDG3004921.1 Ig-like domain repeat protein [Paludisphaera mucosa]